MITKVIGKVDGKEVAFERAEGDLWNTTVPLDLDGMYVVEVTAYLRDGSNSGRIQSSCTSRRLYCGSSISMSSRKGVLL